MHRSRAIVAGLVLALALAAPVSAATSGQVTETLSVNSTLAIVLDRATIDYGALNPGQTSRGAGAGENVTATISGNANWELDIAASDFTGPGGAVIPSSAREVQLSDADNENVTLTPPLASTSATDWYVPGSKAADATGVGGTGENVIESYWSVTVPAGARAGSYTGTITFTVTATP